MAQPRKRYRPGEPRAPMGRPPKPKVEKPPANPVGKPHKVLDTEKIRLLASCFCSDEEIADELDTCSDTLTRNYADVLKSARSAGRRSLRAMQYKKAKEGNVTMQIFLGKQYLGQKDKVENEHTGSGGGAIQIVVSYDDPTQTE